VMEILGLVEVAGTTAVGLKTLSFLEKSVLEGNQVSTGRRRRGYPRTDIERLQRHFGKDWWLHDVSELPPRGTGLKKRRKPLRKKKKSRSRR